MPEPSLHPRRYSPAWTAPPDPPSPFATYWPLLREHAWAVLLLTVACGAAAFFLTKLQRPTYLAHTALEIQSINENFLNLQNLSPTAPNSGVYSQDSEVQTAVRSLKSRSVLAHAIGKNGIRERLIRAGGRRSSPAEPDTDQLVATVFNSLKVQAQANTRVVDLTVVSVDPQLAADLANAIAASYTELTLERRWDSVQSVGTWLTGQMQDLKAKLEQSESAMQQYARESSLVITSDAGNMDEQKLRELQEELGRAQADRVAKQSRFELIASAPVDSLPEVLDSPSMRETQAELTHLRQQLADLSSAYTDSYPKVVKLKAQIASVELARDKGRANITDRIRNEFETAKRREAILHTQFAGQARQLSGQAARLAQYGLLKREADTTRALYDSMGQRVREAGLAAAMKANNIQIMDPAICPKTPYRPSKMINTALGLGFGMLLALMTIAWKEKKQRSTQQPGDAFAYLGVPELAIIPAGAVKPEWKNFTRRLTPPAPENPVELACLGNRTSPLTEGFRSALVSIMDKQDGTWPRMVVVSSALPGEGKTTVACNLAIVLAQTGHRVLLIDGDLRRPRLHTIFNVRNSTGFSDLLEGTATGAVQPTAIPGLSLLPSGSRCNIDALFRATLPILLRQFREEYDVVLIDTPPLLQIADARMMALYSDGLVLTIDSQSSKRDNIAQAAAMIAEDGIPLLGTVLNRHSPTTASGHYHYNYEYHRSAHGSAPTE